MRILIVSSTYLPYLNGQAVFAGNLAEGLVERGHSVMVLVSGETLRSVQSIRNGVIVQSVPGLNLNFIQKDFYLACFYDATIRRVFDEFQPELVHCQDPAPLSQYVVHEARRRKIPVMATHHPGSEISAPHFSRLAATAKSAVEFVLWNCVAGFLNQADLVTCPSRASAQMLANHRIHKEIRPISCGVRLENFHPLPELDRNALRMKYGLDPQKKLFVYVGRIDIEKRVEVLVKAMALVQREDVQLAIAGQGSYQDKVQSLAEQLGLQHKVRFLGQVSRADLPALINCADVFAMPGDGESLSIATLEAMACHKPVLAANAMALPELVTHRVNGYLFAPRDAQDAARGIEELAAHPEWWEKMGQIGAERAARHNLQGVLERYAYTYQDVIASRQPASQPHTLPQAVFSFLHSALVWTRPLQVLALLILMMGISVFLYSGSSASADFRIEEIQPKIIQEAERLLKSWESDAALPANESGALLGDAVEVRLFTRSGDSTVLQNQMIWLRRGTTTERQAQPLQTQDLSQGNSPQMLEEWDAERLYGNSGGWQVLPQGQRSTLADPTETKLEKVLTITSQTSIDAAQLEKIEHLAQLIDQQQSDPAIEVTVDDLCQLDPILCAAGKPESLLSLLPESLQTAVEKPMSPEQKRLANIGAYTVQQRYIGEFSRIISQANRLLLQIATPASRTIQFGSKTLSELVLPTEIPFVQKVDQQVGKMVSSGQEWMPWHVLMHEDWLCMTARVQPTTGNTLDVVTVEGQTDTGVQSMQPQPMEGLFGACLDLRSVEELQVVSFQAEVYNDEQSALTDWRFKFLSGNQ